MWSQAGRDPELFWRLSMCQIVHTLEAQTGGRRRTRDGKIVRKGTRDDLMGMAARFGGIRFITHENGETPPAAK